MNLLRHVMMAAVGLCIFVLAPVHGDDAVDPSSSPFRTVQKLKSIVVSVDFIHVNIDGAIQALAATCKERDPSHVGISFVVSPEASEIGKPITLKLDNVPLDVVLRYVCELSYLKYHVDGHMVSIDPPYGGCGIPIRTFHVDPGFLGLSPSSNGNLPPRAP